MVAPCKIEAVAQAMSLTPTSTKQNELRYGAKCSLLLNLADDCFYDFEAKIGGGVFHFVVHKGYDANEQDAVQYHKNQGLISDDPAATKRNNRTASPHLCG